MICPDCGCEVYDGEVFCRNCGAKLQSYDDIKNHYNEQNNASNSGVLIAVIVALGAIVIILMVLLMGLGSADDRHKKNDLVEVVVTPEPTPSPSPTPEPVFEIVTATPATPSPTPRPTPKPTPERSSWYVAKRNYYTYTDDDYDFSCDYVNDFSAYDDGGDTRYTLISPDRLTRQYIDATPYYSGPKADQRAFFNQYPGNITYQSSGTDYFAGSVRDSNGYLHYKYAKYVGGVRYSFEFEYPIDQNPEYYYIIDDIYKNFKKNFN